MFLSCNAFCILSFPGKLKEQMSTQMDRKRKKERQIDEEREVGGY